MSLIRRSALYATIGFLLAGCMAPKNNDTDMDALLWSTASAEYEVITRQIFFQAQRQLDRLLSQKQESAALEQAQNPQKLPPAVIVDIDETMLSNGVFHYELLAQGKAFNQEEWTAWVYEARARPVPGALDYATHASRKGVTVFYVSNRDEIFLDPTWRNLLQMGFPLSGDKNQILMRGEGASWDKTARRAEIAKNYRVVQVVGDGLGDFMPNTGAMSLEQQRDASASYMAYWGEKWFMLPNPVYGDWETAITNPPGADTALIGDPTKAKYRFIRGGEAQGVW